MSVIDGLSDDLVELAENQNRNNRRDDDGDDGDDGLSGGIIALIVILVILAVSVPVVIVIVYLVYKQRQKGRFDIFQGSIRHRKHGSDYIADNTAVDERYTTGQELQSSQRQEMESSEPEPTTERLIKDDDDTDEPGATTIQNPNFDADADKDTQL